MAKLAQIRRADRYDYVRLGQVFHTAIHTGTSPYTEAQRRAWSPAPRNGLDWTERLAAQEIFLAEIAGDCVGFMSLAVQGYVDFAYILPEARGQGLFRRLHDAIEGLATQQAVTRLHTHASLMAQPAFSAMGYNIIAPELVDIGDQQLKRFAMEKHLS